MSSIVWEPRDGVNAFIDRCIERRGKGWTWRKIALHEHGSENQPTGFSTLNAYFAKYPEIKKKIDNHSKQEALENLRQTGLELAIQDKDRSLVIYLSKAMLKLYDTPTLELEEKEELVQAMSPEQARLELAQLAKKPDV